MIGPHVHMGPITITEIVYFAYLRSFVVDRFVAIYELSGGTNPDQKFLEEGPKSISRVEICDSMYVSVRSWWL